MPFFILWNIFCPHIDRSSKIDPNRHTKAGKTYHLNCRKRELPEVFNPTLKLYLDFSDRPANFVKTSVNPRRHRNCNHKHEEEPVKLPKIKAAPMNMGNNDNGFSDFHLYAWNQLYLRLHRRLGYRIKV
ncbi:hypothetical protein ACF0H5_017487 [Mactra antiquata]